MREKLFVLSIAILAVIQLSCNSGGNKTTSSRDTANHASLAANDTLLSDPNDTFCNFIPKDSANKMIGSYQSSIHGSSGSDSNLNSLIIDVKKLEDYINQTSTTGKAVKIKLMFAHTLSYINNGGMGVNCGYQTGKLTMVLATYDSAGNYIYKNGTMVMDNMQPCPSYCPVTGTAANNLLQ